MAVSEAKSFAIAEADATWGSPVSRREQAVEGAHGVAERGVLVADEVAGGDRDVVEEDLSGG
jgi:hypothetical protein